MIRTSKPDFFCIECNKKQTSFWLVFGFGKMFCQLDNRSYSGGIIISSRIKYFFVLFIRCITQMIIMCSYNNIFIFESKIGRAQEHTSELQSRENLVCRLLLEKKKTT